MIARIAQRTKTAVIVLLIFYFAVQMIGHTSVGLTDDDDFYIPAGISYVDWIGKAVTFQDSAWSRKAMDAAFDANHEHPPFAKYVFGLCHYLFRFLGPTDSARMGTVFFSTLVAFLLLILSLKHFGRERGLVIGGLSVLFLLFLPRFYFHSHAATLDIPVAAMYLAAATLALLGERSTRAAWWAGPVFGLALATKLNAPFLVVPYLIFAFLVRLRRNKEGSWRSGVRLPTVPLAAFTMAIIGPLVFIAVWPWLWFDFAQRIVSYVGFHLHHYGIYFLYFGRVFSKDPFAPWHAPFTMAATTVPLAISILALIGIGFGVRVIWRRLRDTKGPDNPLRREGDLLLSAVLHALVSIAVVSFSGGPKYGGAKLFMPFFPFWCLLAGYGAVRFYEYVRAFHKRWIPIGAISIALCSVLGLQLKFGAYALSEYNGLTGGLRGATATGFERQYYDIAFRDLVAWLNENAPQNARVHFLPNNWEYVRTYRWYKKGNELRYDIQVVNEERRANLLIITHERRFARYGNDLQRNRMLPVLQERIIDGVPIWSVLKAN